MSKVKVAALGPKDFSEVLRKAHKLTIIEIVSRISVDNPDITEAALDQLVDVVAATASKLCRTFVELLTEKVQEVEAPEGVEMPQ